MYIHLYRYYNNQKVYKNRKEEKPRSWFIINNAGLILHIIRNGITISGQGDITWSKQ